MRGAADEPQENHGPGRRAEPHRAGDRVRLLLRARGVRAARRRLRDHHGQLQPGDGVDRLRHLGSPVLRAGDAGRRARDRPPREALGRDRAVRRPDAAQARARPRRRRGADHRHQRRLDRHRRGPRALPAAAREAQAAPAAEPHRALGRRSAEARRGDRLPGGGAAKLRARRARHGDRPPAVGTGALHDGGGEGLERLAGAARPLPVGCDRDRRRLRIGRQERDDRRHHGARRAGGRALGRLGLLPAAALAREPPGARAAPPDRADGEGAQGQGPDERAVRDPEGHGLRAGSESARLAHRAVRVEGDRRAARHGGGALHGGPKLEGAERRGGDAELFLRQGSGVPLRALPGRRHHPRTGDEVDRRGDGRGRDLRRGLRQVAARRGGQAARGRARLHQRARRRQARRGARGARPRRARLRAARDARHRRG